jgi:hypothetical protein
MAVVARAHDPVQPALAAVRRLPDLPALEPLPKLLEVPRAQPNAQVGLREEAYQLVGV